MMYWPRKRAKHIVARVRNWPTGKEPKLLGFAAYKVGMTHLLVNDNVPTSNTKGQDIQMPVTILECPPIKIAAINFYTKDAYGLHASGQILADKLDKELSRTLRLPKNKKETKTPDNLADVRVLAYTQPKLTGLGKKRPEVLEIALGGSVEDKLKYAQEHLGKEINIADVFTEGQVVDTVSISKGKGFQGPVKRFGVMLRVHKSEKSRRNAGSLGPWHGHRQYRVPKAGQLGFQQRTETNKHILKIGDKPEDINAKGGFLRYGNIKSNYILIKGSIPGASKRLITFVAPRRPVPTLPKEAPPISYVNKQSHQ